MKNRKFNNKNKDLQKRIMGVCYRANGDVEIYLSTQRKRVLVKKRDTALLAELLIRQSDWLADDSVRDCQRRLKQAEADVLADKASRANDPLISEILWIKSSLIMPKLSL